MTSFALDRTPIARRAPLAHLRLALDRDTVPSYSVDGHLRSSDAVISKAEVSVYLGSEVPDFTELGLDPTANIQRAAPSFDQPLFWGHKPLHAENHRAELVVGATDARFDGRFLRNSLVIWLAIAISAIEDGTDIFISCVPLRRCFQRKASLTGSATCSA